MRSFASIFRTSVLLQIICLLISFVIVEQLINNSIFNWSPAFAGP
jgi:hypothetical protein